MQRCPMWTRGVVSTHESVDLHHGHVPSPDDGCHKCGIMFHSDADKWQVLKFSRTDVEKGALSSVGKAVGAASVIATKSRT